MRTGTIKSQVGVSFEKVPVVRTRLFYNSKMSKRDVEGLIARGNKTRFLRTGNMTSGHKFSRNNDPRDVGKCNSRVVTDECMVYNKTPLTLTPPSSDKKVRVEKQGGLLPRVTPVAGNSKWTSRCIYRYCCKYQ